MNINKRMSHNFARDMTAELSRYMRKIMAQLGHYNPNEFSQGFIYDLTDDCEIVPRSETWCLYR